VTKGRLVDLMKEREVNKRCGRIITEEVYLEVCCSNLHLRYPK
jgi:hypothetical protein